MTILNQIKTTQNTFRLWEIYAIAPFLLHCHNFLKFLWSNISSLTEYRLVFSIFLLISNFHPQNQLRSGRAPLILWIFKTFPAVFALNASMFAVRHGVFAHSGPTGSWPDCGRPKSASAQLFRLGARKSPCDIILMGQSSDEGEEEEEWEEKTCQEAISEPAYIRSTLNIHPKCLLFHVKTAG